MIIALVILGIACLYLLSLCIKLHQQLRKTVDFANQINTQLDNVRTVVLSHNEVVEKLAQGVEYLLIKDGTQYLYMGERGNA